MPVHSSRCLCNVTAMIIPLTVGTSIHILQRPMYIGDVLQKGRATVKFVIIKVNKVKVLKITSLSKFVQIKMYHKQNLFSSLSSSLNSKW